MATWAYAQDKSSSRNVIDRTFTVGHILIGAVTGPLFFALGLYYALSVTPIMEYVDKLLSLPLFTWRGKDM
jgi:hypothetical protein